jgi:hypothetical protein
MVSDRESVEYKYRLDKGEALLYTWKATGRVNYELHAEPDGAPRGYAESFEKKDGKEAASGDALGRWLLQDVARIPEGPGAQDQDVSVARMSLAVELYLSAIAGRSDAPASHGWLDRRRRRHGPRSTGSQSIIPYRERSSVRANFRAASTRWLSKLEKCVSPTPARPATSAKDAK